MPAPRHHSGKEKQRGAALMVMLVILVVGITTVLVNSLTSSTVKTAQQEKTAAALAQAKEALIGRAIFDDNRPGSLPCPDTDNDGIVNGVAGNCTSSYIGRFPWKTLELPDIGDGNGEHLWYVLSPSFRDNPTAGPLNSVSPNLWTDPLTLGAETNIVAIIFAPGAPLSGQNGRPSNNIADYMEGANADGNSIYANGPTSETFNDSALAITRADLMAAVEKRMAAEARRLLMGFYANSSVTVGLRHFPYAATLGMNSPTSGLRRGLLPVSCRFQRSGATPNFTYISNCGGAVDLNKRSNFKFTAATGTCSSVSQDNCQCGVGVGTCTGERIDTSIAAEVRSSISLDAMQIAGNGALTPTPADWLMDNQWERMIFFAIAAGCTTTTAGCSGTMLSTSQQSDLAAVVISTGAPLASTETKTTPQSGYPSAVVDDYLDSAENINNDDVFSMIGKARTPTYNDTVITIQRGSL
ncbi:MAG: hypothetical protein Q8L69_15685 [Gallionellaceae bacterium]|nr:hypothetical protein [Gallionellaceae bacterium]